MTTTIRNEAAEQFRQDLIEQARADGFASDTLVYELDAALAAERRATVERIRERLGPMGPGYDEPWGRIAVILDEEAAR